MAVCGDEGKGEESEGEGCGQELHFQGMRQRLNGDSWDLWSWAD
jgi:hypothetical protein